MRLLEFSTDEVPRHVGLMVDGGVADLTARFPDTARSLDAMLNGDGLFGADGWHRRLSSTTFPADVDVAGIRFEPLLAHSCRVFAIGLNYEKPYPVDAEPPPRRSNPPWFAKLPGCLVGHEQPIVAPDVSDWFNYEDSYDYEAELTAVIGVGGRHIPVDDALGHIAGWTCCNDGSVRHWQRHSLSAGKNFQDSGSIGPWMVTADEIDDPQNLAIGSRVDGEKRQQASTADMLFPVSRLVSYLSEIVELRPGDVVVTGSPDGSGGSFEPPRFLEPGQTVEVEIEGIGVLRNRVVLEQRRD